MNRRNMTLGAACAVFWPGWSASAQTWPDKPVRFVLSQPPGSGPDAVARLIAERLSKVWGQSVWVENRAGGQNIIGAQAAAHAAPDGQTFYFATTAALVTNAYLFKQLPYDPQKDFVPVAFIARSPFGLLVEANSPFRTLQDLVDRARAEPGKVSLGNEGPRTFGGMISRMFAAREKIELNQVAYASVNVAVQDTVGGHVQAVLADVPSSAAMLKSGRLRLLAVTTAHRLAGFESVPALAETLPGFEMMGWFALVAPTGTPSAVVQRANRDVNALLNDRELADQIASIGPLADGSMGVEQLASFLRAEHARWAAATREIGVLPE